mmetsp:Transcript_50864/g.128300  ORF Transcript_50864/g.128300 Transcript_50864/m.128300 type:complete len:281 (-) Transcript_50864:27-869(-)
MPPPCLCSQKGLSICHDDSEPDAGCTSPPWPLMVHPPPLGVLEGDLSKALPAWLDQTLRPLVAKVANLQAQVNRCQARVEIVAGQRDSSVLPRWLFAKGPAVETEQVNPTECLEAVLRQLDEGRQSINNLQFQTERLQEAVASSERSQKATREEMRLLHGKLDQISDAALDLDFGPPIGKTMNTQDIAQLHAETRADLDELRKRLDDMLGNWAPATTPSMLPSAAATAGAAAAAAAAAALGADIHVGPSPTSLSGSYPPPPAERPRQPALPSRSHERFSL